MSFRDFHQRADAHISDQVLADCRALYQAIAPDDQVLFDELVEEKQYGAMQPMLRSLLELAATGDYPNAGNAQQESAKRLLNQLQFTGEWKQRG